MLEAAHGRDCVLVIEHMGVLLEDTKAYAILRDGLLKTSRE